jgi:hypothetical protein
MTAVDLSIVEDTVKKLVTTTLFVMLDRNALNSVPFGFKVAPVSFLLYRSGVAIPIAQISSPGIRLPLLPGENLSSSIVLSTSEVQVPGFSQLVKDVYNGQSLSFTLDGTIASGLNGATKSISLGMVIDLSAKSSTSSSSSGSSTSSFQFALKNIELASFSTSGTVLDLPCLYQVCTNEFYV